MKSETPQLKSESSKLKSLLVIAGEVSGDMHAAHVVRALMERDSSLSCWGIGGEELRACGMELVHDAKEMAVMGFVEVVRRYAFFRRVFNEMCALTAERRPDAVLLVDYPGFNLRFAERCHAMGIKVLYYVCPQVWAWHRSRIGKMARILDHLFVIFPFEVDVFEGSGLSVEFVGHPLVDETRKAQDAAAVELPWQGGSRIGLLPGSRRQEVERILPEMWKAAGRLDQDHEGLDFLVAASSEQIASQIREVLAQIGGGPSRCEVVVGQTREILKQASVAMVASGTATIEAALMHCPMVVVYKTSWLTYHLGRMLVSVSHIGMVNIVAGRSLCPEFIQGGAEPAAMADAVGALLFDQAKRDAMLSGLREVAERLGEGGAADKAADAIFNVLK